MCSKKMKFILIIILYIWINSIWGDGSIAMAAQIPISQAQLVDEPANSYMSTETQKIESILEFIVKVILTGTVAFINIFKYMVERKYEIESVDIELVNERPFVGIGCIELKNCQIYKGMKKIDGKRLTAPYYLDIHIKMSIPNTKKKIRNIAIRKLNFYMNGYRVEYDYEKKSLFGIKKCQVNQQNGDFYLLMRFPAIMEDTGAKLNPVLFFQNPQNVYLKFRWLTNVSFFSKFCIWIYKSSEFEFEKMDYKEGSPRIGIKSKGIY